MDDVNRQNKHQVVFELFAQTKTPIERKTVTWYMAGNMEGLVMENIS